MEDRLENRKPIEVALPGSAAPPIVFRPIVLPGEVAEFRMGSREGDANEQPVHTVRLTEPYYMAETPVTQAQFLAVKEDHENHTEGADHPADQVTWLEAMEFCRWLTQPEGRGTVKLPTEAQWEYACPHQDWRLSGLSVSRSGGSSQVRRTASSRGNGGFVGGVFWLTLAMANGAGGYERKSWAANHQG